MFFTEAKKARIYASLQTCYTKRVHVVVPCVKYVVGGYMGRDSMPGFTVVLTNKPGE